MLTINELISFLGWCSVINLSLLVLSSLFIFVFKDFVTGFHSRISGIDKQDLVSMYFQYLGNYKIVIIVLNLVPYIALKIVV